MVREHCYRASLPSKYNFSFSFVILQERFFMTVTLLGVICKHTWGRCTLYMCWLKSSPTGCYKAKKKILALIHFVTASNVYIVIHRDGSQSLVSIAKYCVWHKLYLKLFPLIIDQCRIFACYRYIYPTCTDQLPKLKGYARGRTFPSLCRWHSSPSMASRVVHGYIHYVIYLPIRHKDIHHNAVEVRKSMVVIYF
jgi:hypothetical protein